MSAEARPCGDCDVDFSEHDLAIAGHIWVQSPPGARTVDEKVLDALLAKYKGNIDRHDDTLAKLLTEDSPVGLGDQVRYDHALKQWHIWNGVRWEPDRTTHILDLVRERALAYLASPALSADDHKGVFALLDTRKKESVLTALASKPGIAMRGDEWDKPAHLIGFDNGILNLDTSTFHSEGDQADLITRSVGYAMDPKATCSEFDAFLAAICADEDGNRRTDVEEYVLLAMGASLYGHTKVQQFYLVIGPGNGGKGALCRTFVYVLGGPSEYAATPASNLYTRARFAPDTSRARPDLMDLYGRRIAWLDEPPGPLNDEMLKTHSGEGFITARALHKGNVSWMPTHTIWATSNVVLAVTDVGLSMRRRVRVIPFLRSFIPDPDLESRLRVEAPGIMRKLAQYAKRWHDDPASLLDPARMPEAVREASKEFIEDSDPMAQFIEEKCVLGAKYRVSSADLYDAWRAWCEAQNDPDLDAGSSVAFGRTKMVNRAGIKRRLTTEGTH